MTEFAKNALTHYDDCHMQVRRDFYQLSAYNKADYNKRETRTGKVVKDEPNQECMAKILRVFETLTDSRRMSWHIDAANLKEQGLTPPNEPKEFPLVLSYGAIVELLYGTHGESTVRNSLAVLAQRGYIKQYQPSKNGTPLYVLNIGVLQEALKRQAESKLSAVDFDTPKETAKSQVSKSNGRVSKSTATPPKNQVSAVDFGRSGVEIDNNKNREESFKTNKNSDKKERERDNASPTSSPSKDFSQSSSSTGLSVSEEDTLNLANVKPEIFAQHTSLQQSSESVAPCQTAPQTVASNDTAETSPIAILTPTTHNMHDDTKVAKSEVIVADGYMIPSKGVNEEVVVDNGSTGGSEPQGQDASSTIGITQAEMMPVAEATAKPDVIGAKIDEKGPVEVTTGHKTGKPKTAQQTLIDAPLVEPDMVGSWNTEKVVQYAEWCNGKRYPDKQRTVQIEAARTLHREDAGLTLEQFKLAYDECLRDGWWRKDGPGDLHVKHMQVKIKSSGVVRLYAMLHKAEQHQKKIIPFKPKVEKVEPLSSGQVNSLAEKAKSLAEDAQHEIVVTPVDDAIIVHWNTPYFEKPERFTSEEIFLQSFAEMRKIWQQAQKKKAVM